MRTKLAAARRRELVAWLREGRELSVAAISGKYGVTHETARRDLIALEGEGVLTRVHGGALPLGDDPPYEVRHSIFRKEKRAIGEMAAALIGSGERVYISSGSTTIAVAEALSGHERISAMTHMPLIAEILANSGHEAEVTGGTYSAKHKVLEGDAVPQAIAGHIFDTAICSVYGLDINFGVVDFPKYLSELKKKLRSQSRRMIWLAGREKFGVEAPFLTLPFDEMETLVTSEAPPGEFLDRLLSAGVRVIWPGRVSQANEGSNIGFEASSGSKSATPPGCTT